MNERLKNGLLAAALFAGMSALFHYLMDGEVPWPPVTGSAIGGFIAWYFFIPRMNKNRKDK
ncbi:MAG: hypothetical protein EA344_12790 [Alkalicoccus sp.]|nr:MAG: hypothetical protein EA344_12790 [Alkalicoccus sp.]